MSSRKVKGTKRESKVLAVQLKRPFLTGLLIALGVSIGSALVGLATIAAPIAYLYIQGLLAQ